MTYTYTFPARLVFVLLRGGSFLSPTPEYAGIEAIGGDRGQHLDSSRCGVLGLGGSKKEALNRAVPSWRDPILFWFWFRTAVLLPRGFFSACLLYKEEEETHAAFGTKFVRRQQHLEHHPPAVK